MFLFSILLIVKMSIVYFILYFFGFQSYVYKEVKTFFFLILIHFFEIETKCKFNNLK